MLNWLHTRPSMQRRAARPARAPTSPIELAFEERESEIVEPIAESSMPNAEEVPPPFFSSVSPSVPNLHPGNRVESGWLRVESLKLKALHRGRELTQRVNACVAHNRFSFRLSTINFQPSTFNFQPH